MVPDDIKDAVRAAHQPGKRGFGYAALGTRFGLTKKQVAYILNEEDYRASARRSMSQFREDPANRAKCVEAARAWREADPEATRARDRDRYAKDSRKRLSVLAWQAANPAKRRQSRRTYEARVKGASGAGYTAEQWQRVLLVCNECCVYCQTRDADTSDHVRPLSLGGSNEPHNLIPACRRCNSSKSATPLEQWQGGVHLWVVPFAAELAEVVCQSW